jgi:hypothetical protein
MPTTIKKTCKECSNTVTPILRPGIGCSKCQNFYHFNCAKLLDQDINYIESNPVGWLCSKCNKPYKRDSIIPATPLKVSSGNSPAPGTSKEISQKTGKILRKPVESKKQSKNAATPPASSTNLIINKPPGRKLSQKPTGKLKSAPSPKSSFTENTAEYSNFDKIATEIENLNQQLKILQGKIDELQLNIGSKELRIDELERQGISKKIEIQGLSCEAATNPLLILKRIGEEIDYRLVPNDLVDAYILTSKDKRVRLIAEFASVIKKEAFIRAGRVFKRKGGKLTEECNGSRVFINQLLTTKQKTLLYNTKEFAKNNNFNFVWVHRAQILLKKEESSIPIYISSTEDLDSILNQND